MDNNKRIDKINVDGKFDSVRRILQAQLKDLDAICDSQVLAKTLNATNVRAKLNEIDNFISSNTAIQDALIANSADVKAIIESINLEILDRMNNFKANFRADSDKTKIDDESKYFTESTNINKTSKELDTYEGKVFGVKKSSDREKDAKTEYEDLSERFEAAKAFKEMVDKDPTLDRNGLIQSRNNAKDGIEKIENEEKRRNRLTSGKTANDYKNIVSSIRKIADKQLEKNLYGKSSITKDDIKTLNENLRILEALEVSGNNDLKEFVSKIKSNVIMSGDKITGVKPSFGDKKEFLYKKYTSIDFDKVITDIPEKVNEDLSKRLQKMLNDEPIFAINPELKKEYMEALNGTNPNLQYIKEQLSKYISNVSEITDRIENVVVDYGNIDKIENDMLKAEKREKNLTGFNNKSTTTKLKMFGQEIELKDSDGNAIDFSKVADEDRDDIVSKIYDKFNEGDISNVEDYVKANETSLVTYEKPSLLSRFFYKMNPAHWKKGDNLATHRETEARQKAIENATKKAIIDGMKEMTDKPAWYLTPEQAKSIKDIEMKRAEDAKKKGREEIVRGGKTATEASKSTNKEIKEEQAKSDEEMEL